MRHLKNYKDRLFSAIDSDFGHLPFWLQFFIFLKRGLYNGPGWKIKWGRVKCWFGYHKEFIHTLINRTDCVRCGLQERTHLRDEDFELAHRKVIKPWLKDEK